MATLFSYFTKTPKKPSPQNGDSAAGSTNTSPKETASGLPTKSSGNGGKLKFSKPCGGQTTSVKSVKSDLLEIVWAKLEGHPIWPSIICKHPTLGVHLKNGECHVQFFGDPPSRGWIKLKQLQPFINEETKGGNGPAVKKAVHQAEEAMALSMVEREKLISCIPSDEEGSEDEMECDENSSPSNNKENKAVASSDDDDDDDDDVVTGKKTNSKRPRRKATTKGVKKRKRVMIESGSEDSGSDDFKPDGDDSDDSVSSGVEEDDVESAPSEDEEHVEVQNSRKRKRGSTSTPLQKKGKLVNSISTPQPNKTTAKNTTTSPALPSALASKINKSASKAAVSLARFQMASSPTPVTENNTEGQSGGYTHEKLQWLKEHQRKDNHGRPMSHPEYDPKTLLVPQSYLNSKEVTPAMRQWWQLKSDHFDTVLFFKVGKFYELYHMDATTGVKELNLIYMKGYFAHAGFPEIAFGRYSDTLIQKGYKIARVEQTETPDMMRERCKKQKTTSKYDQVVKREICAVTTQGTKMYSFRDGDCTECEAAYLLAIAEKGSDDTTGGESSYGVCFVDTSIGKFHIGQFKDDRQASRLRTLVAHHAPVQVLCCRGGLTSKTQHILSHELMSALTEHLAPGSEFWDGAKTLKFLAEGSYFQSDKGASEAIKWPEVLKAMANGDPLGLTPSDDYQLALSALGSIVWYLKKCLIEEELLSMGKFEEYHPLDSIQTQNRSSTFSQSRQHMILDDVTLSNLDILPCGPDMIMEGTLLERLDHCSTAFGKRLFKQWLCAPLCNPTAINDRLNAIEDLMAVPAVVADLKDILRGLPDLERLLRKIHSLGSVKRATDHPDGRAILYNEDTYSKRKIADFLAALDGLSSARRVVKLFKDHVEDFKSKLLKQIVTIDDEKNKDDDSTRGRFPKMYDRLRFFQDAFDHNKAKKDGVILPQPGVHAAYDLALSDIITCKNWFDRYLDQQRKRLGCRSIVYWGTAKNRFQIEVPESALSKHTPDEYTLQSQKKGFRRFWTREIEDHLATLTEAEDRRDAALKDTMRTVFQTFDKHYDMWDKAVQCLSVLDAILSLTTYSSHGEGTMCRPEVVLPEVTPEGVKPFLEIREGRHPCISRTFTGDDFIPNDTVVGIANEADDSEDSSAANAHSTCVLVTGPNMGGKSTLMRQAGLITIMAQLGCYVPAEVCRLTPVDRVFTRLGAHDRILAGESTFFVELSETATILHHSTRNSLVLVDELGRGTATYDGTAIACAVVKELSANIRCRTLFSTHYHSLVEEFVSDPNVRLGHMACMVENDDEEGDPSKETITFLYKFVKGDCPKSYGFNAARLAGIPDEIISVAVRKSRQFEETMDQVKIFRKILDKSDTPSARTDLLSLRQKIKL